MGCAHVKHDWICLIIATTPVWQDKNAYHWRNQKWNTQSTQSCVNHTMASERGILIALNLLLVAETNRSVLNSTERALIWQIWQEYPRRTLASECLSLQFQNITQSKSATKNVDSVVGKTHQGSLCLCNVKTTVLNICRLFTSIIVGILSAKSGEW